MNNLRKMLNDCTPVYGTVIQFTDPSICELMGNAGFNCVWIDLEHTYMSPKEVLSHLQAAKAAGITAIVRVPERDLTLTKKVLEMGVDGILFPMIRTPKDAEEVMAMTLYPPYGTRGYGPVRAIHYGRDGAMDYIQKESLNLCRFLQIEHIDCVDNLEEIVKIPFVDGFIFGPCDLSNSLLDHANVTGDRTMAAVRRAVEILKREGKTFGVACGTDQATISLWKELGASMIFAGLDWSILYSASKSIFDTLRGADK